MASASPLVSTPAGGPALAVRSFDAVEAQVLPGTEGGVFPFWSPDSRFIGFFAQGKLKKIDVTGGPPLTLCDADRRTGRDLEPRRHHRVCAERGNERTVPRLGRRGRPHAGDDPGCREEGTGASTGRGFFPTAGASCTWRRRRPPSTSARSIQRSGPRYSRRSLKAIYADGYLLFVRQGTLLAQSFDAARLRTMGESFPVAENVDGNPTLGGAVFSASTTGVLTYLTGGQLDQSTHARN